MAPSKSLTIQTRRRDVANMRERRRMMLINRGFELLKQRLPIRNLLHKQERMAHVRLTKVDILRMTIQYIRHLLTILGDPRGEREADLKAATESPLSPETLASTRLMQRPHRQRRRCQLLRRCKVTRTFKRSSKLMESSDRVELACDEVARVDEMSRMQAVSRTTRMVCRLNFEGNQSEWSYALSWSRACDQHALVATTTQDSDGRAVGGARARKVLIGTKLWVPNLKKDS